MDTNQSTPVQTAEPAAETTVTFTLSEYLQHLGLCETRLADYLDTTPLPKWRELIEDVLKDRVYTTELMEQGIKPTLYYQFTVRALATLCMYFDDDTLDFFEGAAPADLLGPLIPFIIECFYRNRKVDRDARAELHYVIFFRLAISTRKQMFRGTVRDRFIDILNEVRLTFREHEAMLRNFDRYYVGQPTHVKH